MRKYIHEMADWPGFHWHPSVLEEVIAVARKQGVLIGRISALGFDVPAQEADAVIIDVATANAINTSAIEGETLDANSVRSSLGRQLGIDVGVASPISRDIDGLVAMLLDATRNCHAPLTPERIKGWQAAMFPTGYSGVERIMVGDWRTTPIQVVSGGHGRVNVHFKAVEASIVAHEMAEFLEWFNGDTGEDLLLKSGIAHLWFLTIHPFADGNGRVARALTDLLLARSDALSSRFYSLSSQVNREKEGYYRALEHAQKGTLDISSWLMWYLGCLGRAIDSAEDVLETVMQKAKFWRRLASVTVNERQRRMIELLFGPFFGNLTAEKWAKMTKVSGPTALRDINELVSLGVLRKIGDGRSTRYELRRDLESLNSPLSVPHPDIPA